MPLDLEEQEQVDELKAWWSKHGTLILAAVLAAVVAFTGWLFWRKYEGGQAAQASALYETLAKAAQSGDAKALRDAGGTLAESHPRTLYASMGALVAARFYFDRNDLKNAKAQLQWAIERAPSEDFRDLARLRLGAILLDEKAYDEALKIADTPHVAVYDAQFAALKGDVLVARREAASGKELWRVTAAKRLSGGAGADAKTVVVATEEGEVVALDAKDGKVRWRARVSSEVLAAPTLGGGLVLVRSIDSRIFAFGEDDGKRRWVYQRAAPSLMIRVPAGITLDRATAFSGCSGGKPVAIALPNGGVRWEETIALP